MKSFKAKVLENNGNHDLLVEVTEDSRYFKKGDKVRVKVENHEILSIYYLEDLTLEILFDGNIEETYPPQISSPSIEVLDYSKIGMVIKNKTISSKGATFIFKKFTDKEYCYGADYTIEKNENGNWKELDTITGEPLTWNSIAYTIKPGEEKELNIDWFLGYGELKSGTYRLVKSDLRKSNSPESRTYTIYAEFDIK